MPEHEKLCITSEATSIPASLSQNPKALAYNWCLPLLSYSLFCLRDSSLKNETSFIILALLSIQTCLTSSEYKRGTTLFSIDFHCNTSEYNQINIYNQCLVSESDSRSELVTYLQQRCDSNLDRRSFQYAHDSSSLNAFLLISFRIWLTGTDEEALINQAAPEPFCLNNSF